MLARYDQLNMSQLVFHAKNEGFAFTVDELVPVVGRLEFHVITNFDGQPLDGDSDLWRHMWGKPYLRYLMDHVVGRYSAKQLVSFVESEESGEHDE